MENLVLMVKNKKIIFSFNLILCFFFKDFKRFINDGFARELLMPSYESTYANR